MASIIIDRRNGLNSAAAIKGPCRVATTANITLSGLQTIDGVALADGDRVLVKNQTDARDNGIRIASTGNWERSADFRNNRDIVTGTQVYVTSGSASANRWYGLTAANPVKVGTTNLTFAVSDNLAAVDAAAADALADLAAAGDAIIADAESARDEAIAAKSAAEEAAAALPAITANTMLVDNAAGSARETKTFAEVLDLVVPNGSLGNARLADMATATIKGRATAGTGVSEDLTPTQVNGLLGTFVSVAAAAATTIPASVTRLETRFFAPNMVVPKSLVGGAHYRRASFADLGSFPSAAYFRSVDRYLPDGSTDATNGGYWLLDEDRPSVHMTGAVGDGVTDDTAAINAALAYMRLMGGGEVDIFPTGAAYRATNSILVGDGVALVGSATTTFPGTTAPKADWVKYGTWINPTHASNSGIVLQGHGSALRGVCIWHDQPTPTGGAYTPNAYGWAVEVTVSHITVEDLTIANATNGLILNYTSASGGGTHVSLRNIILGCFGTCLKTSNVNDTIHMENIHARPIWQTGFITTTYFLLSTAWDCGYTDNCIVNGFEMVFLARGIYFRNETCLGNTHSLYNAQISGLQLSLCNRAMEVENANTVVTGQINDVVIQQGNMFGYTWGTECLTLNSNYVDLQIGLMRVNDAGGSVMTLGGGTGGSMRVRDLEVKAYSSVSAGQTCIVLNAGSKLRLGAYSIKKSAGNGARFAGAGADGLVTGVYGVVKEPFGRFSEYDATGTGVVVDVGTDSLYRPGVSGAHQCRIVADFNVVTAQAGTTLLVKFSGISDATTTTISSATTGWKNFDSGWIDISQANLDNLANFARPQISLGNGVRVQNGAFSLLVR